MKKKLLATFLALCMLLSLLPTAALAAETGTAPEPDTSWYNADQTTFELSDVADLLGFVSIVNGTAGESISADTFESKIVKLSADIDVQGGTLTGCTKVFRGTFHGQGHTIKNFDIGVPLFSNIGYAGVVTDLIVENAALNNTEDGQQRLGIICRNLNGSMENVHVKHCTITSEANALGVVGGLAAMTQNESKVENCSVENLTIRASKGAVAIGGAFGLLTGNENTVVTNVTATNTTVVCNLGEDGYVSVGEVWGRQQGSVTDSNLTACSGSIGTLSLDKAVAKISTEDYDFYYGSLQAAFDDAKTDDAIVLLDDIAVDGTDVVSVSAPVNGDGKYFNGGIFNVYKKSITFDLNGHSITYNGHQDISWDRWTNGKKNSCEVAHGLFMVNDGGHLTVQDSIGTGTVMVYGMASGVYACSPDSVGTITGGTWVNKGCTTCSETNLFLYASHGGELYITGGSFDQDLNTGNESYLIVEHGGTYSNAVIDYSKTKIVVTGGTFVNMDPAIAVQVLQNADNTQTWGNTNVVADGYIVKKTDNQYTVVAKHDLTSGVYTSDPTGFLANNHYVSKVDVENGLWTVSKHTSSGGGGGGSSVTQYAITVADTQNGAVTADKKNAAKNATVTLTVSPAQGCVLETLTVTDKDGKEVTLTDKGDGKYTFQMPASKVTVAAIFQKEVPAPSDFQDVPTDSYYYDAIQWAARNGITEGVDDAHFAPDASCTRAQIVTFLWRTAGSPASVSGTNFVDVPTDSYYAQAVAWAVDQGIVKGTSETTFSPDMICTRSHAVAFLFRYAAAQGMDTATQQELISGYLDAAQVPGYALPAFNWALANAIVQGADGNLMPNDDCTRAQIVTLLHRLEK